MSRSRRKPQASKRVLPRRHPHVVPAAIRRAHANALKQRMNPISLLVLDFESTGLDQTRDDIIEVAAIGVDRQFNELFRYESLIIPSPDAWERLHDAPTALAMHQANGLYDEIAALMRKEPAPSGAPARFLHTVDTQLARLTATHTNGHKPLLSGSGVSHFDAPILHERMRRLSNTISGPLTLDVAVMRRMYRLVNGHDLTDANTQKTHRAMDDVECHLEELRTFARLLDVSTLPHASM